MAMRSRWRAGGFGGEFVVASADVLHERVPGGQDPCRPVPVQPADRPQPAFQPPEISLHAIVGVPLSGMQRRGDQLIEDPQVSRRPVGGDLGRAVPARSARLKNRRAPPSPAKWTRARR
jgi:hypothetical protein